MAKRNTSKTQSKENIPHWFDRFRSNKIIQITAYISGIFLFLVSVKVIPEKTVEKWRIDIEEYLSINNDFYLNKPFQFRKASKDTTVISYIELPMFTIDNELSKTDSIKFSETDSIKKIIISKVFHYLRKDELFKANDSLLTNYFEFENVLQNYYPNYSQNIKVSINQDAIRPKYKQANKLSEYLYISFLKSNNSSFKDTIVLEYLNFDRKTGQIINLKDLFNPFFQNYAERFYKEQLKENRIKIFFNDYFYLSPNFFLTDKSIEFQYARELDSTAFQGTHIKYKLSIPYDSVRTFINPKSKLAFLIKKNNY